mmetsp:Transcript_140198/g.349434  ORF Transcript_140198/g.349434 Transcript_140198/m.349434 type:complete len:100 (-) Transcript_140198:15-314(-)
MSAAALPAFFTANPEQKPSTEPADKLPPMGAKSWKLTGRLGIEELPPPSQRVVAAQGAPPPAAVSTAPAAAPPWNMRATFAVTPRSSMAGSSALQLLYS